MNQKTTRISPEEIARQKDFCAQIHAMNAALPAQQILSMNWLSSYVEGSIPKPDELTDQAREWMRVQGFEEAGLK